jgi:hypothetical protein
MGYGKQDQRRRTEEEISAEEIEHEEIGCEKNRIKENCPEEARAGEEGRTQIRAA